MSYTPYGGAEVGECLATAARIGRANFERWHIEWERTADHAESLASHSLGDGHGISAREGFLRASNYFRTAEFFLAPDDPRRPVTFGKSRAAFLRAVALMDTPVEIVSIPYEGTTLPGYFFAVDGTGVPRPTVLAVGGFDSTGEELFFFVVAAALRRGYNCLGFDGPGQGEPLRFRQLLARPDFEIPLRAVVDYALGRADVDPVKLAVWGTSLGGYYASRAAAFEPRLKACVVHGAMYDLWDAQASKQPLLFLLAKYWPSLLDRNAVFDLLGRFNPGLRWASANAMWVFGARTRGELLDAIRPYSLKDVAGRITCPTLILHGEKDHFIPPRQAAKLYAELTCPKTLHMFQAFEGSEEHCQMGNFSRMHQVGFDWLDGVFDIAGNQESGSPHFLQGAGSP